MDDLVKRLRGHMGANEAEFKAIGEAADRIEQLEDVLREIAEAVGDPSAYWIARAALGEKKE